VLNKQKVGLALGAGGARGLAHIGVLKILEQEKLPIDFIAGSSAGALIGAMYALSPQVAEIENRIVDYIHSPDYKQNRLDFFTKGKDAGGRFSHLVTFLKEKIIINLASSRISLVSNKKLDQALKCLLEDTDIERTKIPFCAVASDLISGKEVVFDSGNIVKAIVASGSIPGFLPPVSVSDHLLLDGSVVQSVPVQAVRQMGADIIIAVDVSPEMKEITEFDNILEIMARTGQMTSRALTELQLQQADIIIRPRVGQYHWSEFSEVEKIIIKGIQATKKVLPTIKKILLAHQLHP